MVPDEPEVSTSSTFCGGTFPSSTLDANFSSVQRVPNSTHTNANPVEDHNGLESQLKILENIEVPSSTNSIRMEAKNARKNFWKKNEKPNEFIVEKVTEEDDEQIGTQATTIRQRREMKNERKSFWKKKDFIVEKVSHSEEDS